MSTFKAGRFEGRIGDPHPCWIDIFELSSDGRVDGRGLNLSHGELKDLQHVVNRLIAAAERMVPGEVD